MKIIDVNELANTNRDVEFAQGYSMRAVLKSENMGFTVNKTLIRKGTKGFWHYKNHLEACYCISGKGVLTNEITKEKYIIKPDIIYLLDKNDPHTFESLTDVVLISIFNPPLNGQEIHKNDGSYD